MNLKQTVTDSNVATGCSAYFHANVDTIFEDMFRSIIIEVLIKAILAEATKWLLWVLCLGVLEIPRLYVIVLEELARSPDLFAGSRH